MIQAFTEAKEWRIAPGRGVGPGGGPWSPLTRASLLCGKVCSELSDRGGVEVPDGFSGSMIFKGMVWARQAMKIADILSARKRRQGLAVDVLGKDKGSTAIQNSFLRLHRALARMNRSKEPQPSFARGDVLIPVSDFFLNLPRARDMREPDAMLDDLLHSRSIVRVCQEITCKTGAVFGAKNEEV